VAIALTSPPGFARHRCGLVGVAKHGWGRGGCVGGWAGVGQADLAAGGQGAVGLAGLFGEQAAAFGGLEQALVDLVVVEGAGGDQVVEVAGRFPQPLVALSLGAVATRATSWARAACP
jgi:hypothetical protein